MDYRLIKENLIKECNRVIAECGSDDEGAGMYLDELGHVIEAIKNSFGDANQPIIVQEAADYVGINLTKFGG